MPIIILGCGVSGLSCGIRLLEAGYPVTIWTRELPLATTSKIAAAIWYPYKAYPPAKVAAWGQRAYDFFYELAQDQASGVTIASGVEINPAPIPDWSSYIKNF